MKYKVLLCITIITSLHSNAQGRSVANILKKLAQMVEIVESQGNEIVRMEADLVQSEKATYRVLQEGWTYGIFAVGSERIQDLDVEVYKLIGGEWSIISKDTDNSSAAVVSIKPTYTGQYKIVVKAYKFYPGYDIGHYGLIVYHE